MSRVFVVDNYDSFTFNLVHLMQADDAEILVRRNDELDWDEVAQFDNILLSPGPGIPSEAGRMSELLEKFATSRRILGVCLGHQAIAEFFGGRIYNMSEVYHGIVGTTIIQDKADYLFRNVTEKIEVGLYHSWTVANDLPEALQVTAVDELGNIQGIKHASLDIRGIQFHPESIMTPEGHTIMANWIAAG